MALTEQQTRVLDALNEAGPLTTHEVGDDLRRGFRDSMGGYYDRANGVLARLEKRGLVSREKAGGQVSSWYITGEGRRELREWQERKR
jgi:DNA-binding PadR family transcriptional regulator